MEGKGIKIVIAITRFVMAAQFLWAFFDKLFGWGFATAPDKAWIRGGSPTFGFLAKGATVAKSRSGCWTWKMVDQY